MSAKFYANVRVHGYTDSCCCDAEPSKEEVNEFSDRIRDGLKEGKRGVAIVVGMREVDGGKNDADNMEKAFQSLNFVVLKELDPNRQKFLALITAAARLPYRGDDTHEATGCQVIAVYFAGHGDNSGGWLGKKKFSHPDSR